MSRFKEEVPKGVSSRTVVRAGRTVSSGRELAHTNTQTGVSHHAAVPRRVPSSLWMREEHGLLLKRYTLPAQQSEEWRPLFTVKLVVSALYTSRSGKMK